MKFLRRISRGAIPSIYEFELEAGESLTISGIAPVLTEGRLAFAAIEKALEAELGTLGKGKRAWQIIGVRSGGEGPDPMTVVTVELVRW